MLTRRIARAAVAAPRSLRAFSSTATVQRSPVLADITPDGVSTFNTRQKEFREHLVKAQREREASKFRSNSSLSNDHSFSAARETSQGLGSLSTHTGQRAEASTKEPDLPDGLLSRVIYGTKEGREMDAQLEASFSAVLARGKYVHSIVFHQVHPDKVDEYVDLVGNWYPRMASLEGNKVHLVGSWRTEVGDCDTFGMFPRQSNLTGSYMIKRR